MRIPNVIRSPTSRSWTLAAFVATGGLVVGACARAVPLVGTGAYAVEYTRGDTLQRFAPGIVSTGNVFAASLTPDGGTVYFTRFAEATGGRDPAARDSAAMQIMQSRWQNGRWQTAVPAPFSTGERQMHPHVAPDGKAVFFSAPRRRGASETDADGDWDSWVARFDKEGMTVERVNTLANTPAQETAPSMTYDDVLFFALQARGANGAMSSIRYHSKKIRTSSVPVELTGVRDPRDPYITPNGRVLLVSALGSEQRRRRDLFVVRRGRDGRWSEPVGLGLEINSLDDEYAPQLSRDGRHLFFTRRQYDSDRALRSDIYVIATAFVRPLRDALLAE